MNLFRSAALISGLTLLSRITGLLRENVTATVFGAGPMTDAFFVAFRLPNLLRRLFAEGAFSQAFVPLLAEARRQAEANGDPAAPGLLIDRVTTALFWTVLAVTLLGVVGAPILVWTVASGLAKDPATFDAAVDMTRLMFPYILMMSLVSLSAGILNTWRRFAVPAFTPLLLNLACIAAALGLADHVDPPIYALALGVVIGGIAQVAMQLPALSRLGLLPRPSFALRAAFADPTTRRMLTLMAPAVLAVSAQQVSLLINTLIASHLAPGSVSWISFGDRLMEFPNGLLGVALGVVLLSSLSAAAANQDGAEFDSLLDWGLRIALLLTAPCAVALALMAEPLTAVLYHYGRFEAFDVHMTALTVQAYAVGLIAIIGIKVLAPGYFARQNVRTPVRIALFVLVITQLLNLVFVPLFAHAGLALSLSVAAIVNAGLLLRGLLKSGAYTPAPGWWRFIVQVVLANGVLATALWYVVPRFDWIAMRAEAFERAGLVLALVAGGAVLYGIALLATGIRPRHLLQRPRVSPTSAADGAAVRPGTIDP